MKQLSAKLKSRGATAVVLTLALGAAVYLNWSFSREAPPSLVVSDTAGEADTQMMSAEETANKNYGEAQLVSVNKDSGTEFFESARLTRSKARDEALDTLKKSLKDTKLTAQKLVDMIELIEKNTISGNAGKKVLVQLFETDDSVDTIVDKLGLKQVSDEGAIQKLVDEVLAANPKSVADYKKGKKNAIGFLVGQCMKASKGKGNPKMINQLLSKTLDSME